MFNDKFMHRALEMAKTAFLADEIPIGALIINPTTNQIITQNYNLVEQRQDPTAHAEMLAITSACQALSSKSLAGLDLYITLQPCTMCLQAAIYAKIRRIYFGAYDHTVTIAIPKLINHQIEIYGGICETDCKEILDRFFVSKR